MGKPSYSLQNLVIIFTLATIVHLSQTTTTPTLPNFDLSSTPLDPATTGFIIRGNEGYGDVGGVVGAAGDVDGDGYDDIIVSIGGVTSVIYGRSTSSLSDMKLSPKTLDPATTGFAVEGNFPGMFIYEYLVDFARKGGDVNGDGYDDIIFGTNIGFDDAYNDEEVDQEGRVYVIFGRERFSEDPTVDSEDSSPGKAIPGYIIKGIPRRRDFGFSVNLAGDIDGDGYDDIIIGTASNHNYQGVVYIIYGKPTSLGETTIEYRSDIFDESDEQGSPTIKIDISQKTTKLDPAIDGFTITGDAKFDQFGISVSSAGDVNGDGYDDIIIGATRKNQAQEAAYVVYGGPKSSLQHMDLGSTPLDPANTGFMIKANSVTNQFKIVVSTAGDVNGDGYDDLLIGTPYKNRYRGIAYVVYGGPNSSLQHIDLNSTTLDPLSTGFMITGNIDDQVGYSVSTAGDVNGDGFDDIIIGAPYTNKSQGAAYVLYGGLKSSLQNIDLNSTTLDPFSTGFMIRGNANYDDFGWAVSTAGDMNGDGFDDIIIGAPHKNKRQGEAYLIHAGSFMFIYDNKILACIPNETSSCTQREFKSPRPEKNCEQGYYRSKFKCKRCPRHCPDCTSLTSCRNIKNSYHDERSVNIDLDPDFDL